MQLSLRAFPHVEFIMLAPLNDIMWRVRRVIFKWELSQAVVTWKTSNKMICDMREIMQTLGAWELLRDAGMETATLHHRTEKPLKQKPKEDKHGVWDVVFGHMKWTHKILMYLLCCWSLFVMFANTVQHSLFSIFPYSFNVFHRERTEQGRGKLAHI